MLLALLGALAVGLCLGLLGSGGSILTLPVLLYLVDRPDKLAIAESLAIVGSIALFGAASYAVRRQVDWKSVTFFGLTGMVGANCGACCACYISGTTQITLFACVMIVAGYMMLSGMTPTFNRDLPARSTKLLMINGFLVGGLTGLVGVGGGFLIVPALVLVSALPMHIAVGTSLVIIAMNALSGFFAHLPDLATRQMEIDWQVIVLFASIGIIGTLVGSAVSGKIPQQRLKQGFALFIIPVAFYTLIRGV